MTDDRFEQRLTQILAAEADAVEVRGTWDDIAIRLVESDWPDARSRPIGSTRRRRVLAALAAGCGVAAVILLAVLLVWRPAVLMPAPVANADPNVPRYDPSIATIVVYRTTAGFYQPSTPRPAGESPPTSWSLTPERMRTESRDVGKAALEALFDTRPVQPGNTDWLKQLMAQGIDVTSVTGSGGLIRVELRSFFSPPFKGREAEILAQAWVRTLQDTLGVRDPVLITLQGKPFWLYGSIDTTRPLTRDESVRIVRPDGFDSPRDGDVAPSTFMLLGTATAGPSRPAHVRVIELDTGAIAYDWDVVVPDGRVAPVDFMPVLTLEPGAYRATLTGHGAAGIRDIRFTVVDA